MRRLRGWLAVGVAAGWSLAVAATAVAVPPLFKGAVETQVAGPFPGFGCYAEYTWLFAFDATADGRVDLVAGPRELCDVDITTVPSRLDVLAGDGRGHFRLRRTSLSRHGRDYSASAVADIDADGHLDLVGVTAKSLGRGYDDAPSRHPRRAFVALGDGRGGFRARSYPIAGSLIREDIHPPVVGRFVGDRDLDLAVGVEDRLQLLEGRGDGSFGAPVEATYSTPHAAWPDVDSGSLHAASFNPDRHSDVFFAIGGGGADLQNVGLLGEGHGRFRAIEVPPTPDPFDVDVIDLDGDGLTDVIAPQRRGGAFVSLARRDGRLAAPRRVLAQPVWAGDLDRDGHRDGVVYGGPDDPVFRFDPGRRGHVGHVLPGWELVTVRRVDGDRRPDLLIRHGDRLLTLLSGRTRTIALKATARAHTDGETCVQFRARSHLSRAAAVVMGDERVNLGRDGRGRTCAELAPGIYDAYLIRAGKSGAAAVRVPSGF